MFANEVVITALVSLYADSELQLRYSY